MTEILIACEESQAVTKAFREKGIAAFSCDILPCSGGHPEWHIQGDVLEILPDPRWAAVIAFPPCTDLAVSGAAHFVKKQADGRQQRSIDFFMQFANLKIPFCIENPIGIMSTKWRKPDQIIQPWMFGDNVVKTTCLWLNELPLLVPIVNECPEIEYVDFIGKTGRKSRQSKWYYETRCLPHSQRGSVASKMFPGISSAMADQWSQILKNTGK